MVVKGEEETSDGLFFLSPFSADVLYAIGAAVIAVVVIVWVYNRVRSTLPSISIPEVWFNFKEMLSLKHDLFKLYIGKR